MHEVALVEVQDKVEALPLLTLAGLALSVTVGVGGAVTVTVADWEAEPPSPEHVSVNFVVAVKAGVDCVPVVAVEPPQEALQEVALVDDHVSDEVAPLLTVAGFAARVTVGAGVVTETVADCAAVPPLPLQLNV